MRLIFGIDPESATPQERAWIVAAIMWKYPPPASYAGTPQRWVREVLRRIVVSIGREYAAHLKSQEFAAMIDQARADAVVPDEVVGADGVPVEPLPEPGPEDPPITPPESPDIAEPEPTPEEG
jgi:hypothetical protein